MPATIVQIDIPDGLSPVLAFLEAAESGLVAPDPAGYVMAAASQPWKWRITVNEACVGIYRLYVRDGDGVTKAQGWVWIRADDTGTYVAVANFELLLAAKIQLSAIATATGTTLPDQIAALENLSAADARDAILDRLLAGNHDTVGSLGWLIQQIRNVLEADQDLVDDGGVRKLKTYLRSTTTELIPAKTAKRTDGADLTDPATEKLSGLLE